MGQSKDGKYWCDYCGIRILRNLIREKRQDWTFCCLTHRNDKMTLVYGHENLDKDSNVVSIYQSFQKTYHKDEGPKAG